MCEISMIASNPDTTRCQGERKIKDTTDDIIAQPDRHGLLGRLHGVTYKIKDEARDESACTQAFTGNTEREGIRSRVGAPDFELAFRLALGVFARGLNRELVV